MSTLQLPRNNQLLHSPSEKFKAKDLAVWMLSAGLIVLGGRTILLATSPLEQVSAGSLVVGASGLVGSLEGKKNERIRLENERNQNKLLQLMFSSLFFGDGIFMMPDWGTVNTVLGGQWQTIEVDAVNEDRKDTASILSPMKSAIASSPFGVGVKRFFFDRREDQRSAQDIVDRLQEYKRASPILLELSEHLEHEGTQYQLKALAKEACNYAIEHTDQEICESLNLQEQDTRYQFYTDVYFYLRVWLKNSIEYDMEMPDIGRSLKNVSIYLKAFQFLRSERADYFLVPEENLKSAPSELVKVISQYLDALIEKLESDRPGQGVFGRLLNPHH